MVNPKDGLFRLKEFNKLNTELLYSVDKTECIRSGQ